MIREIKVKSREKVKVEYHISHKAKHDDERKNEWTGWNEWNERTKKGEEENVDRMSGFEALKALKQGMGSNWGSRLDELIIFLDFAEFYESFHRDNGIFTLYFVNFLNNFSALSTVETKKKMENISWTFG